MFFRRSILLLFISAILFISCTATDEENNFVLRGTLFSEGGEPYSAIDIHIRNYLAPNGFVEPEGTTYTTNLSFTVEETSQVSLVIFKYAKQEILSTIVNEELPSGQH
ncbi:MAG: hypothetical protein MI700_05225, partial [Balneolales bacterium]|nr:hypothetical protein [Balneolales bacterium]